ncbi:MAG: putative lipid II flippase FtsW, partial [Lysobacter sp.]|nr:putative lipid II flippase FtsW [Lysobacter sp.]
MTDGTNARHQATRLDAIEGRFDPWLLGAAIALASVGVVMVASSSIAIGEGLHVGPFYFLVRHLVFLAVGVGLAAWMMRTELKAIEAKNQLLLLACFVLLLSVFVPGLGRTVNGARRWLNFGVSNFQAVEAVKLLYIVWLASYLVRFRDEVNATWKAMLKPLGVAVALVALLIMQPDFGSLSLILAITAGMLVLGGVNMPRMFGPVLVGLPILAAIAIAEPYRVRRFTSFLDPWADPFDSGYQLTNALMAVGRGEIFGVGLGASVQKLSYLPEAHTDFIMAVIAEELGLVGVALVIGLYALLAGRAFWVGLKCVEMRRHFAGYCAFGVALWMSLQSFVSIGVNLGLLPTKGLTLPLISSGGSSVLMTCMAIGLLLRVSYEL